MTCKDCIHYDVCHRRINSIDFLPVIKGKVSISSIMYKKCDDVEKYSSLQGKFLYDWHISDLVIYDKPKSLYEFSKHDNTYNNAFGWVFDDRPKNIQLTRPPYPWSYVEEKE